MKKNIDIAYLLADAELYKYKIIPHVHALCYFFDIGVQDIQKTISLLLKRRQNSCKNTYEGIQPTFLLSSQKVTQQNSASTEKWNIFCSYCTANVFYKSHNFV